MYSLSFFKRNYFTCKIFNSNLSKLFLFSFQMESISFYKLFNRSILLNNFSLKLLDCNNSLFFRFNIYYFNLFFSLVYISLEYKNLFFVSLNESFKFVNSLDLFLKFLFSDFLFKYNFLVRNFLSFNISSYYFIRNFFSKRTKFSASFIFSPSNLYFRNSLYFSNQLLKLRSSIPLAKVLNKFRCLGFIHVYKLKSISQVKYIFSEDFLILRFFLNISSFVSIWFRKLTDFKNLFILLNLLKKSCLLTLSRKHKKSLVWSYVLYTSEVLYFRSISNFSFFLKPNDYYYYSSFYFSELCFILI